ncbi:hypothetical protein D3C87_1170830 [compost metagenome]
MRLGLLPVIQVVLDQRQPRVAVGWLYLQQPFQLFTGLINLAAVMQRYRQNVTVLRTLRFQLCGFAQVWHGLIRFAGTHQRQALSVLQKGGVRVFLQALCE